MMLKSWFQALKSLLCVFLMWFEDIRKRFNLDSWNCISFTAFLLTVDTPHFIQDARISISDPRSLIIQFPMVNRINRCWIQFKLRKKYARNSSRNWNLQNPSYQMHFARFWLWGHMAYLTKNWIRWSKSGHCATLVHRMWIGSSGAHRSNGSSPPVRCIPDDLSFWHEFWFPVIASNGLNSFVFTSETISKPFLSSKHPENSK